jgi:hypothetical protein
MNILLLIALSLAGVLAAPVPRTRALTRNVCADKLQICDCVLVRRRDDDDLSSQTGSQPSLDAKIAKTGREPAKLASTRYLERLAIQNPEKLKRLKQAKAVRVKARRIAFSIEQPEEFERLKVAKLARMKAKRIALSIEQPEEFKRRKDARSLRERNRRAAAKRRKEVEAVQNKAGELAQVAVEISEEVNRRKRAAQRKTRAVAKLPRAPNPKMTADHQAQTLVGNKHHRDKEAAEEQAPTQTLVTDRAAPSTQLATSPAVQDSEAACPKAIHWQNKRYRTKRKAAQPLVTDPAGSSTQQATSRIVWSAIPGHSDAHSSSVWPYQVLHPNGEHAGPFQAATQQHETSLQVVQPTHQENSEPDVDVLQWLVNTPPPVSPGVAYGDC